MKKNDINSVNNKLLYSIAIVCIFVILIFLTSAIINIYDYLDSINNILAIVVLIAILLLLLLIFIIPIIKMLALPTFSLNESNKVTSITYIKLKKVARNLINNENSIPFEDKKNLEQAISNKQRLCHTISYVNKKYIKKDINKVILETSGKVALTTSLSKNKQFDFLIVVLSNIKLIMKIVSICGYRPTYARLSKLIIKVFRNALIAYTIESFNIAEGISSLTANFFKSVPLIGKSVGLLFEASANGLFTARIGILTRKYLFKEYEANAENLQEGLASSSTKEAFELIQSA